VFQHNPTRANQAPSFRSVGENLAISSGRGDAYEFLFNLWNDERQDYTYNSNRCDPGRVCGHYTQVSQQGWKVTPFWHIKGSVGHI